VTDLWPLEDTALTSPIRSGEVVAIYAHRWEVPRNTWVEFFASAEQNINILAYSAPFISEDAGLLEIIAKKAYSGVKVNLNLGDPQSQHVIDRGSEEGIGPAMPAKVRNALVNYRPLGRAPNVQLRLHGAVLYNSVYRSDDQLLVNQHVYGTAASQAPVCHLRVHGQNSMAKLILESVERIWRDSREANLVHPYV
jgi:hypothetical protein